MNGMVFICFDKDFKWYGMIYFVTDKLENITSLSVCMLDSVTVIRYEISI